MVWRLLLFVLGWSLPHFNQVKRDSLMGMVKFSLWEGNCCFLLFVVVVLVVAVGGEGCWWE